MARGCGEIALLGQNGEFIRQKDLDTEVDFADLIRMVNDIECVGWYQIFYIPRKI